MSAAAEFELDLEYSMEMPRSAYQYPDLDSAQYMYDNKPMSQNPGIISDGLSDEPLMFEDEQYFDPSSHADSVGLRPSSALLGETMHHPVPVHPIQTPIHPAPLQPQTPSQAPSHAPSHAPVPIRPAPSKHNQQEYANLNTSTGSIPSSLPAVQDLGICEPLKWQQGPESGLKVRNRPSVARIAKKPSLKQLIPKRSMNNLNETINVRSAEDFLKQKPTNSQPILHRTVQPRARRVSAPASAVQKPQMPMSSPDSTSLYTPVFVNGSTQPKTPLKQPNQALSGNSPTTVLAPTPSQWRPMVHNGPSPTPAMRYKSSSKLVSEASEFSPAKGMWQQNVQSNPSTPNHAQNRAGVNRPPPVQLNLNRSPRKSASTSNMRREMRKKAPKLKDMTSAMNQFQVDLKPKTFIPRAHKPHKTASRTHSDRSGPFDTLQNLDSRNQASRAVDHNPNNTGSIGNPRNIRKSHNIGNGHHIRDAGNAGDAADSASNHAGNNAGNQVRYRDPSQYNMQPMRNDPSIANFDSDNWYPDYPSRDTPQALMMESQQLQNQKYVNNRLNHRLDTRSDRPRVRAVASQPSFGSNGMRTAAKMYSLPSIEPEEEYFNTDLQLDSDQQLFNTVGQPQQPFHHHTSANTSMPYTRNPGNPGNPGNHQQHQQHPHSQHQQHQQHQGSPHSHRSSRHRESMTLNNPHLVQPQLEQLNSQDQQDPQEPNTPEDYNIAPVDMIWPLPLTNTSFDEGLDETTVSMSNMSHSMSNGMSNSMSNNMPHNASHNMSNNGQFTQESTLLATGLDDVDEYSNWNTVNALDLDSPWNFMDSVPDGL